MLKQLDAQNILAFLERVSVTGTRESSEYLRCCQLLVEIAQHPAEAAEIGQQSAAGRPTLVSPTPAAD
jgi:hypothetical protein